MNDQRHESFTEGVEAHTAREIVADEDVLSYSTRAALEQVGSATGFVLALALVCALLPRAAKVLAAGAAAAPATKSEDREDRAIERRALDASLEAGFDASLDDQASGVLTVEARGLDRPSGARRV